MKHLFFSLLLISGSLATAQELWMTDAEEAFTLASEKELPVMMVFSGSDWCKPCIQLTREVFDTGMFKGYAEGRMILLKIDFPKARKNRLSPDLQLQNNELAERWNTTGEFPLVLLFSSDQSLLFATGYRSGGPEAYILHLAQELSQHEFTH